MDKDLDRIIKKSNYTLFSSEKQGFNKMIDLETMSVERFAKVFDMAILAPETQDAVDRKSVV